MVSPRTALERLRDGNRRFVSGVRRRDPFESQARRKELEIVFDQDVGDLFVIRVAGNIVASSQVGSVGHTGCGAVQATLEEIQRPTENQSRNLRSIVDRIRPSVQVLLATEIKHDPDAMMREAVRANIRASGNHLKHGSEILERLIESRELVVVGAEYSLETGVVEFLDAPPA